MVLAIQQQSERFSFFSRSMLFSKVSPIFLFLGELASGPTGLYDLYCSGGFHIAAVCATRKGRHSSGNRKNSESARTGTTAEVF